MRRVLFVSGFWPTDQHPITGIFVKQQVQALVDVGCIVWVIAPCPLKPGALRPRCQESAGARILSPRYLLIPQKVTESVLAQKANAFFCRLSMRGALERVRRELGPEVIHLHGVRPLAFSMCRVGVLPDVPLVLTLHGRDPYLTTHADSTVLRKMLEDVASCCDLLTLVGKPLEDYARSLGFEGMPRRIVPNGTILPDEADSVTAPENGSDSPTHIVSISNLIEWKGIDVNLRALARLKSSGQQGFRYTVIGDGPKLSHLEELTEKLGLEDNVEFLGRLAYEETMSRLAVCDVFSLPSWGEPFGIVYLEAMARGKPVIGCKGAGAEETVRHGVEGLLVPGKDVEALTTALGRLVKNPPLRKKLGKAGRKRARQFTWERNALQYLKLYQELIDRPAGASDSPDGI